VTGLSLPDSDIDICIIGFTDVLPENIPTILNRLSIVINKNQYLLSLKEILSAKVPVLKLILDLGLLF
jgi:DNA polymerase sigma